MEEQEWGIALHNIFHRATLRLLLQDPDQPFLRKSDGKAEKFEACEGRERYRERDRKLLFNLREDPWETKDLSGNPDYLQTLNDLEETLASQFELVVKPGTHFDRN